MHLKLSGRTKQYVKHIERRFNGDKNVQQALKYSTLKSNTAESSSEKFR